eukprot:m.71040 g.71040  ORF g.71040 m.71040 type:complete len:87 (-) comp8682_c0_seq2:18-278(-)
MVRIPNDNGRDGDRHVVHPIRSMPPTTASGCGAVTATGLSVTHCTAVATDRVVMQSGAREATPTTCIARPSIAAAIVLLFTDKPSF